MKKKGLLTVITALAIMMVMSLTSCSKDTEDATSGVWYLSSYGSNVECTWGEYIAFSDNQMVWGLRDRGKTNSYFKVTCTGSTFKCVAQDGVSDNITFTIKSVSGSKMTTTSTDNIERHWRR